MINRDTKILITGAAGLVGQNLVIMLKEQGFSNIVCLDKHKNNTVVLSQLHPDIGVTCADLAEEGDWEKTFLGLEVLIILHAQITGKTSEPFVRNNIEATQIVLAAAKKNNVKYIIHISSSVVISVADDDYTNTKKTQEELVKNFGFRYCVLRPPLMFGWFDKKHLGWLSRFMAQTPVFPVPNDGKFLRQPLYVRDLCSVIIKCLERQPNNNIYNIIGREPIYYVDIIKTIKQVCGYKTLVLNIPYSLFYLILKTYGLFSASPPFTTDQLKALMAGDEFEVYNWWDEFGLSPTSFLQAMQETHYDNRYSKYILDP
jgi:nucleoside-diphosphate-sugar epimerase